MFCCAASVAAANAVVIAAAVDVPRLWPLASLKVRTEAITMNAIEHWMFPCNIDVIGSVVNAPDARSVHETDAEPLVGFN